MLVSPVWVMCVSSGVSTGPNKNSRKIVCEENMFFEQENKSDGVWVYRRKCALTLYWLEREDNKTTGEQGLRWSETVDWWPGWHGRGERRAAQLRQHADAGGSGGIDHGLQVLVSLSEHNLTGGAQESTRAGKNWGIRGRLKARVLQRLHRLSVLQQNRVKSEDVQLIKSVVHSHEYEHTLQWYFINLSDAGISFSSVFCVLCQVCVFFFPLNIMMIFMKLHCFLTVLVLIKVLQ